MKRRLTIVSALALCAAIWAAVVLSYWSGSHP